MYVNRPGPNASPGRISGRYITPLEHDDDRVLMGFDTNDLQMWDDEMDRKDIALRHCPAESVFLVIVD